MNATDEQMADIERGATFLNDFFKTDRWKERIDLATLDMGNYRSCIIGQLYDGAYNEGLDALEIENEADVLLYGFDVFGGYDADLVELTDAWREYLNRGADLALSTGESDILAVP